METPATRKKILRPDLKIKPDEINWYFIEDYYDGPIAGLAVYQKRVVRFCTFPEDIPEHHLFVLHELTEEELGEELRSKEEFEAMVGTHWSYNESGEPLPRVMRSAELRKEYHRLQEQRPTNSSEPGDRPILAWFDIREKTDHFRRAPR